MYSLVIGRSYPEEKTGMMGIFEFEQAKALGNYGYKTVYSFCDTRSIKSLRNYGYMNTNKNNIFVYGYHLPIGGVPTRVFNSVKKYYYERLLKRIIDQHGTPDVIHVHFPLLTLNQKIWQLLKSLNRPIIVTEHWTKVQTKELLPKYSKLLKKLVNEADGFICVGEQLKKSIVELTNIKRDIRVIPNMVSPMFYYKKQNLRNKDSFTFITVGRLVEVKRFNFVVKAFSIAFKNNPNVRLDIVGGGALYNTLKQQINDLNMGNRITMYGFLSRDETAELMRKSNAFVSGSILETFGVPFIEAMACGKPVIGIKYGPIDSYINETNGILFEKDNLGNLVNVLRKLYENREKYNGKSISQTAIELFSEKAIARQLDEIFNECIEEKHV